MAEKSNNQLDQEQSLLLNSSQDSWTIQLHKIECDEVNCFTPFEEPIIDPDIDIETLSNDSGNERNRIKLRRVHDTSSHNNQSIKKIRNANQRYPIDFHAKDGAFSSTNNRMKALQANFNINKNKFSQYSDSMGTSKVGEFNIIRRHV